eukprot:gene9614-biopygen8283
MEASRVRQSPAESAKSARSSPPSRPGRARPAAKYSWRRCSALLPLYLGFRDVVRAFPIAQAKVVPVWHRWPFTTLRAYHSTPKSCLYLITAHATEGFRA